MGTRCGPAGLWLSLTISSPSPVWGLGPNALKSWAGPCGQQRALWGSWELGAPGTQDLESPPVETGPEGGLRVSDWRPRPCRAGGEFKGHGHE